jgi:hypothetical protein
LTLSSLLYFFPLFLFLFYLYLDPFYTISHLSVIHIYSRPKKHPILLFVSQIVDD